jgi:hypothetical protein
VLGAEHQNTKTIDGFPSLGRGRAAVALRKQRPPWTRGDFRGLGAVTHRPALPNRLRQPPEGSATAIAFFPPLVRGVFKPGLLNQLAIAFVLVGFFDVLLGNFLGTL